MNDISHLVQHLRLRVDALYARYHADPTQKIKAKFDRSLFRQDSQTLSDYLTQIEETLALLADFSPVQKEQLIFFSEKLAAQCAALSEALQSAEQRPNSECPRPQGRTERLKQALNLLPPRERLVKYYEALQALNEKIAAQQDNVAACTDRQQQIHYLHQLEITRQRRQRCLEAIEVLEEYLNFQRQNKENG
ncbi:restart primosome assembly protein PriC [Mesocricetibacter intestinalis]|uniref:Restart primosome assembly protein PriC n=1 Tax=Mesocricetibacter intestinalis TaxID=1521930 RepID=A0A4R6VFN0_9PAST|nr:primosomal replication protein PriC [Mesocricetibacter intestinalis]TDQ59805.1 restart primosome assembly protein PriC [Mesocricetibacter intestinalis]